MSDQPAQGSTADYCSAYPGEPHHRVAHCQGGGRVHVERCSLCGWIDFDELNAQVNALVVEGRRQATEGWEREWGARGADGWVFGVEDGEGEQRARAVAAWPKDRPSTVVSRLVGPWEPAEQTQAPGLQPGGWSEPKMAGIAALQRLAAEQAQDGAR
jgi:hypothetical protein